MVNPNSYPRRAGTTKIGANGKIKSRIKGKKLRKKLGSEGLVRKKSLKKSEALRI